MFSSCLWSVAAQAASPRRGQPFEANPPGGPVLRRSARKSSVCDSRTADLDRLRGRFLRRARSRRSGFQGRSRSTRPAADPDTADRVVGSQVVHNTRGWIARRFPELMNAPLVDARVCQYENTSTGDFIIDRHPAWSNLWIVGGGSGHGFKHGPAVARHVAALLAGDVAPQPRFALESKSLEKQRAVF